MLRAARPTIAILAFAAGAVACIVDVPDPNSRVFYCVFDDDCAEGFTCDFNGVCIDDGAGGGGGGNLVNCPRGGGQIDSDEICDSASDCPENEDEEYCSGFCEESSCYDGSCMPFWYICDGVPDCSSGEDESYCPNNP